MAFLMLILLIAFTITAYYFGGRSFVSPWFLMCAIFLFAYVLLLLNYRNWNVNINGIFIIYIISAIVAFGGGCAIVNFLGKPVYVKNGGVKVDYLGKVIKTKYPVNFFLLLTLLLSCVYIFKLLLDVGTGGTFTDKLRRIYELGSECSPGFIFTQCREIITAIAYINTFRIIIRVYTRKDSISFIKLLIPIIAFFVVILISTERNFFLRYAIYFLCVWILIYKETHNQKYINLKIFAQVLLFLVVIVLMFFIMGKAKQYKSDFFKMISIYAGSGLNDFNLWIKEFNESLLFGKSTFTTFLSSFGTILKIFGINLQGTVSQFDPFIEYVSPNGYLYSSNIYTSLRPYIEDFGYLGVIFIPFLIGVFYQWLYNRASKKAFGLAWVLYALLVYAIIYFPIGEQLFRRFHLGFIYEIVWITIIYKIVFGRKKCKVVKGRTSAQIKGAQ